MSKDYSPSFFLELGTDLKGRKVSSEAVNLRRFKSWFGIEWRVISVVWYLLWKSGWMKSLKQCPNPVHLLWALLFLKEYKKEADHASDVRREEKTFRKWAWFYAEGISTLVSRVVSAWSFVYY